MYTNSAELSGIRRTVHVYQATCVMYTWRMSQGPPGRGPSACMPAAHKEPVRQLQVRVELLRRKIVVANGVRRSQALGHRQACGGASHTQPPGSAAGRCRRGLVPILAPPGGATASLLQPATALCQGIFAGRACGPAPCTPGLTRHNCYLVRVDQRVAAAVPRVLLALQEAHLRQQAGGVQAGGWLSHVHQSAPCSVWR